MSAQELKRRVDGALERLILVAADEVMNARRGKGITMEDIAMFVLEANAFRRGLEKAKDALLEEYTKFVAPDSIPSGASEEDDLEGKFYQ